MLSFADTRIAFIDKSDAHLKKSYWLFFMVKSNAFVKTGAWMIKVLQKTGISLRWILKPTIFDHFCGGETLQECRSSIQKFQENKIKVVLDYAAEGIESEEQFDSTKNKIIETIQLSKSEKGIAFAVFKFSGIARASLLEKVNSQEFLTETESEEWDRVFKRANDICTEAFNHNLPVMIDAEETWIQGAIDEMTEKLMQMYNKQDAIVYNTLQMYRTDRLFYLKEQTKKAKINGYKPAFKLVRGAYMEKERKRAQKYNYASPLYPDKKGTDNAFDNAMIFCLENADQISVCIGTHNETSCEKAIKKMNEFLIPPDSPGVFFSQLTGMSDHISYNLAYHGYNVAKYLPYGPLKLAIPYLIRRAQENTSVSGQTGREINLLRKEMKRRRK
ncbi:MAG: proline dehydrogenase family protein [Bacteroidota bacterium]